MVPASAVRFVAPVGLSLPSRALALAGLLSAIGCALACDGPSEFTPQPPDAGNPGDAITAADIGVPCTYDYADPTKDPASDCKNGLACLIFTSDGEITSDLELSGWEDQFTTFGDEKESGMCTLQGTYANPPSCPAGTVLKLLWSDVAVCARACNVPADCGRADYTCDVRYFDTDQPLCVRKCLVDVPDCVRSAIIQEPQSGQLIPVLAFEDLSGSSQCGTADGVCQFVETHGVAGPGEPCARTQDCEAGSACIQAPVLDELLTTTVDREGPGFCASPCTPVDPATADPQSNCSIGFVCQAAGHLNINFELIGGPFVANLENGALDARGGFCFHQCELGVESACAPFPGTDCGSFHEAAAAADWNGITQCLPPSLKL